MSRNSNFDGPSHNTRGSKRRQTDISLVNQEAKIQKMIANEIRNAIPSISAVVKEALRANTQPERLLSIRLLILTNANPYSPTPSESTTKVKVRITKI